MTLIGHTSADTAYVVEDYPYGFRLRTKIRYYIETSRYGQRFVSQTLNPQTGRWNSPKAGTYHLITVMYLGADNHVTNEALFTSASEDKITAFEARFSDALTGNREREIIRHLRAARRADKRVQWTVGSSDGPRQTLQEQAAIMHALTRDELHKEMVAAIHGETYP